MDADTLSSPSPPVVASVPPVQPACWSSVLQKKPTAHPQEAVSPRVFGSLTSSKGISVAVLDANALIHGDKLTNSADKFVSVPEVLNEVRDHVSRQRLSFLPFPVETMEPSPEFIKKVVNFARETGDLQTLSDVDLKVVALAYMLEAQIHGTDHLRDRPPPLHVVNVKNLPGAQMPGWGSNVPNLAEWEALEEATEGGRDHNSKILGLRDMNNQDEPNSSSASIPDEHVEGHTTFDKPKRSFAPNKESVLEGKKMVASGIDASQGEDTEAAGDWHPAVSRTTQRNLRRKAMRELSKETEENGHLSIHEEVEDTKSEEAALDFDSSQLSHEGVEDDRLTTCIGSTPLEIEEDNSEYALDSVYDDDAGIDDFGEELAILELDSQADESIDTSYIDDQSSEQSWMLKSLSESNVACVTSDYAMQNVLLQIGLRLLAPGGMQIRQLHRWVLKCHACNKVTQEIGRIFCPKCGNGGTLRKVSVTVGENGIIMAARRPRIVLRGTKFSLPLPQGGREAITKNLILREDQLPHKLLYPKSKNKSNKQGKEFLGVDDIFSHSDEKRLPLKPPVRKALAMFGGKRNPNDNHFSRRKH